MPVLPRFAPLLVALLFGPGCGLPPALAAEDPTPWLEALRRNAKDPFGQRERERAIRELGLIGGPEAAQAVLALSDDPFEHLADRAVSALGAMLVGPRAEESRRWLIERGLKAPSAAVRRDALLALGGLPGGDLAPALGPLLRRERDPGVLEAALEAAAGLEPDPTLAEPLEACVAARPPPVAARALGVLARHAPGAALALAPGLLGHREPRVRAGAVDALAALGELGPAHARAVLADPRPEPAIALAQALATRPPWPAWPTEGVPLLAALLEHPAWRARSAAIQAALGLWDRAVVPLLIARLGVEQGRLRDDARRALETLTGRGLGGDPDLWRAWWEAQPAAWTPGPRPLPDALGRVAFRPPGEEGGAPGTRTAAFFDLPLASERVAFLFDLSGSMDHAARRGGEGPTKLEVLRAEMRRTLKTLPPAVRLDLCVYRYPSEYPPRPRLTRALGRLEEATPATARRVLQWLEGQEAQGWGAFYEPIVALFEDDEIDTVVLLSDGRPSRGRYDRDDRLLLEIPRANRFAQVAVSTVLIGEANADRRFMERLAAATGGRFQSAPK